MGPALEVDYSFIVVFLVFRSGYRSCVYAHFRFPITNIVFAVGGVKQTDSPLILLEKIV